ncbi:MAG: hypothetical protein ACT4OZ_01350 [Gemmatimonadota bacterium]
MVTPSVAQLVDANGRLPSQHATVAGAISITQAVQLAERYIRLFGPQARTWIEGLHGGPIDFSRLRADARVVVSESPFEPLDTSAFPPDRKRFGPYYLVSLHDNGHFVVTVAVSALSSDITIDSSAVLTAAAIRGNDFLVWPVPRNSAPMPVLSPEQAIAVAFQTFGQSIDALPTYERKGIEFFPHEGAWRLSLDKLVEVRLTNADIVRTTNVLYVVNGSTFAIASAAEAKETTRVRGQSSNAKLSFLSLRYRETAAPSLVEVQPVTRR